MVVIATGSTLGVTLHKGAQFPVGKVNRMELHPLTYLEFLGALGQGQLAQLVKDNDKNLSIFHEKLINLMLQYMYVGGMPLPVFEYARTKNFSEVRKIQMEILSDYRDDFSKYTSADVSAKLRLIWDNIPTQLSHENKKFLYGALRSGARAREFESAIEWLKDSSLINIVHRITVPIMPLKSHLEFNAFKIYIHDVGLLSALAGASERMILDNESIFSEHRGALAEQFVCQELVASGFTPAYWSPGESQAEVDFVVQGRNSEIIPIEVKSGTNLRTKSMGIYIDKYNPNMAIRSSQASYKNTGNLYDVPLYLLSSFLTQDNI